MDTHAQPSAMPRRDGHLDAESLFRTHARFVAGFMQRLGAAQPELDDLVQEVFMLAHRKGGYLPGPAKPRTWLAALAVRVVSQGRRAQRARRDRLEQQALLSDVADSRNPAQACELRDSLQRVQRALDTLDLDHRVAFLLYEVEGETCPQIAAALGVPVGTVYSRLHHARQRFHAAYAEQQAQAESEPRAYGAALLLAPEGQDWIPPLRLRHDSAVDTRMRADLEGASCTVAPYDISAGVAQLQAAMNGAAVPASATPALTSSVAQLATSSGALLNRAIASLTHAGRGLLLVGAGTLLIPGLDAGTRIEAEPATQLEADEDSGTALTATVPVAQRGIPEPKALRVEVSALHREIEELGRIKTLVGVDPARAYRLTRVGQQQFRQGSMGQEREALAVIALWNAGHYEQAVRDAREFVRRHPDSPMRERLEGILHAAQR